MSKVKRALEGALDLAEKLGRAGAPHGDLLARLRQDPTVAVALGNGIEGDPVVMGMLSDTWWGGSPAAGDPWWSWKPAGGS